MILLGCLLSILFSTLEVSHLNVTRAYYVTRFTECKTLCLFRTEGVVIVSGYNIVVTTNILISYFEYACLTAAR